MIFTQEQINLLNKHRAVIASLFEFSFLSKTEYLWNGMVDRKFGDSVVYKGLFGRIEVPEITAGREGQNIQETIVITGLDPAFSNILIENQGEVRNRLLYQKQQLLDSSTNRPVGPPRTKQIFVMRGVASNVTGGSIGGQAPVATIGIKIETLMGSRSENGFGRYTNSDQFGRNPDITDNIFNDVPLIATGRPIQWP